MTRSRWLSSDDFAQAAGISTRAARKALERASRGGSWNGQSLAVRQVTGRGGRSGIRYEVLLSSLPGALQRAFNGDLPDAPCLPSPVLNEPYSPRLPTHSARALELFEKIKPATGDHLTGAQRGQAIREIVARTGMPMRTVQRLVTSYNRHGIEGLMRKRPANAGQDRCAVSMEFDKAFLAAGHDQALLPELSDFVDRTIKGLWKSRAADAGENDLAQLANYVLWEHCRDIGAPMPLECCTIGRRRVRKWRDRKAVNLRNTNAKAFQDSLPHVRRRWTDHAPMQTVVADVKHLDVLVTREDGTPAYPKLIAFMDAGTQRMFPYLVLCPQRRSITQELVIEAFLAMANDPHWGLPGQLYLDNGSEFGGLDKITQAIALLNADAGREIIRAKPYHAGSKPVEGMFARADRYCFSAMPGYTGGNRMAARTQNVGRPAEPFAGTWAEFASTVGDLIAYFHQRQIGGQWGDQSANALFQAWIDRGWRPTLAMPMALEISFCDRKQAKVSKQGIRHAGKRYHHPQLCEFVVGETVELIVPWRKSAAPIVVLPRSGAVQLSEDFLFPANDLEGAREAGRRKTAYKAAVASMDREVPTLDPIAIKRRMARDASKPIIPGNPRFLDHGAAILEFKPAAALIDQGETSIADQEARRREAEKRRTARLERAMRHGR